MSKVSSTVTLRDEIYIEVSTGPVGALTWTKVETLAVPLFQQNFETARIPTTASEMIVLRGHSISLLSHITGSSVVLDLFRTG